MKSLVALRLGCILAGLVLAAAAPAAGQEPAPKAGEQSPPIKEITGTITSVDDACASFVLLTKTEAGKTETKFERNADLGPWLRELEGCSVVYDAGEKMLLKPGLTVTVRYSVQENKNLVSGFVVMLTPRPDPCATPDGAGGATGKIFRIGCAGILTPVCVSCPNPPYTQEARDVHLEGTVVLQVVLRPDGKVSEVHVIRSVGKGLDESAVKTVRKWRFKPAIGPEGKPVVVEFTVEIAFHLLN